MDHDLTPVLIGVGQVTERDFDAETGSSPLDLIEQAVMNALQDAGISKAALSELDTLAIVKSFRESTRNSPEVLANRLGAQKATQWLMPNGGNGPQYLVNRYAAAIARGESRFALFSGSEAMATGRKYFKSTGEQPPWQEPSMNDPALLVEDVPLSTPHENAHGLYQASTFYAMSENALRHHHGVSIDQHQRAIGKLFAKFTDVAAQSAHAWYPTSRPAEEIAYPSASNRFVAWPYTKYMNAMNQINQSAALLLTSVQYAKEMGVSEDKFVYLHGCADTREMSISNRPNYYSSKAMSVMAEQVMATNNFSIGDMSYIDFYSCFPSAVQLACDSFNLPRDTEKPLTVTGGLPFHGGAGNNYVMNSIAQMVEKVRADRGKYGLITANGGYFSKHAAGIYSTNPTTAPWSRVEPGQYQHRIDDQKPIELIQSPMGHAEIETYTVTYGRDGKPNGGVVIGRLGSFEDPASKRFLSVLPNDEKLLNAMTRQDMIGEPGSVSTADDLNVFQPG